MIYRGSPARQTSLALELAQTPPRAGRRVCERHGIRLEPDALCPRCMEGDPVPRVLIQTSFVAPLPAPQTSAYWQRNTSRSPRQTRQPSKRSKLNDQMVAMIRARYKVGETIQQLAVDFHVTPANIWQIVHRTTWKHVR